MSMDFETCICCAVTLLGTPVEVPSCSSMLGAAGAFGPAAAAVLTEELVLGRLLRETLALPTLWIGES